MNKTIFDRAIEYFSPELGARRAYARYAIETAYQAAKMRRMTGSTVSGAGPNAELLPDIARLRNRTRDQSRNNGYARNAKRQWGTRLWSTGMLPTWDSSVARNEKLERLWRQWSPRCWGNGPQNAGSRWESAGLAAINAAFESGEVLFLRRPHEAREERPLHVSFDLLEADHLDTRFDGQTQRNGGYIRGGIEHDATGRRVAYHLYEQHPGEWHLGRALSLQSKRVPASEVIHLYEPDRPGATRGAPHGASVAERVDELEQYLRADITQKRVAACMAAFVTRPDGETPLVNPEADRGKSGERLEKIQPAMIHYLANGESVQVAAPAAAGGVRETALVMGREIAAGYGMPYEIVSGDWSTTNYSSSRSGLVGFADAVSQYRWLVLRPVLDALVQWFLEAAYVSGALDVPPAQLEGAWSWTEPEFRLLDRLNEAQSDEIELNLGTLTWAQAVRAKGYDPVEQAAEIEQWKHIRSAANVTGRVQSEQNVQDERKGDPPTRGNSGDRRE